MRWDVDTKNKIIKLRIKGYTYGEIRQKIGEKIAKSTLSHMCRKVKLPKFYQQKIDLINVKNREKGRRIALEISRLKKDKLIHELKNKNLDLIKDLNQRDRMLILAIFHLSEGGKYPVTRYLRFGNSNTNIIKLFLFLLRKSFILDESKFRVEILCRADQNINFLIDYWQEVTGINKNLFYKPRVDKRTIGKPTKKKDYRGVCVINYLSSKLQLELQLLGESLCKKYIFSDDF